MSQLAIVCIVLGMVFIIVRGPLLVAPTTTLRLYRKLVETDARLRITGVVVASIGLAMLTSASESGHAAAVIFWIWGWFLLALSLPFGVLSVALFRWVFEVFLDIMDNSDLPRIVGVLNLGFGALLIYPGVHVF